MVVTLLEVLQYSGNLLSSIHQYVSELTDNKTPAHAWLAVGIVSYSNEKN